MALCSYVERRRERYYFRLRVPPLAGAVLGREHVVASLLTRDAAQAKLRAAKIYLVVSPFLHMLCLKMRDTLHSLEMPPTGADALADAAFRLGCDYHARLDQLRLQHEKEMAALQAQYQAELRALTGGVQKGWRTGVAFQEAEPMTPYNEMEVPRFVANPGSFMTSVRAETVVDNVPPAPEVEVSPPWHSLTDEFLADKPGLTDKTVWSYNHAFDHWRRLIGDKPIAEIRRGDLKLFADHLRDMDSGRGGKLSHASIVRMLNHVKIFMSWAVEAGYVEDDRFGGVKGRDKTHEERMGVDNRRAFTVDELRRLFSSPLFMERTLSQSDEAAAWFLALAAFTGARTKEIATAPAKLVQVGEVWCLDLRQSGKKTRAAARLVPLIPELIQMGILGWAKRQAEAGRGLLELADNPRSGAAWSKYLNRYIGEHVLESPDLVLYSLRHSFRQMLRAANIGDELANKVFGHEGGSVGAGYGRALSEQEAVLMVTSVKAPFDLKGRRIAAGSNRLSG